MKTTDPAAIVPASSASGLPATAPDEPTLATASSDPVTAEDVGHPVSVGIGALSAGAAGAAIGAVGGPIGILVGAVIGAVAGAMVGEEVAASGEEAVTDNPDSSYTNPDLLKPTSLSTGGLDFGLGSQPGSESLYSGADQVPADTEPNIPGAGSKEVESAARQWAAEPHTAELSEPLEDEAPVLEDEAPAIEDEAPAMEAGTFSASADAHAGTYPEDTIRTSAYYHYIDRAAAGLPGDALEDWVLAEREMQA